MEEQPKQTPMDNDWFESKDHPYAAANELIQNREWAKAEEAYSKHLKDKDGTPYDQQLAQLNFASAQFAQGKASQGWHVYDMIPGSAHNRLEDPNTLPAKNTNEGGFLNYFKVNVVDRIKGSLSENSSALPEQSTVVVNTNDIGIGDIFHFLKAVDTLQEKTSAKVTLSTKGFLHSALKGAAESHNFTLGNSGQIKPDDYSFSTHLISLLGHLEMSPADLKPEKVVLTAQEEAINKITQLIASYQNNNKIGVVFLGENREAIVMGGKKLKHRHLDATSFEELLKQHSELILIDCNPKASRISDASAPHLNMDSAYTDRIMPLPDEGDAFDTTIAMGLIASTLGTNYYGFAADNGCGNVFGRALNQSAQQRTAFIIPDEDYDMRMEGKGNSYTQLLSDCRVYKCDGQDQSEVILGAYNDMTE